MNFHTDSAKQLQCCLSSQDLGALKSSAIFPLASQMVFIFAFIALWAFAFWVRPKVTAATAGFPPFRRAFSRAISYTLCYGVGIIGGEGFALPGPIIGALVFFNGIELYPFTSLCPLLFWVLVFFHYHYA